MQKEKFRYSSLYQHTFIITTLIDASYFWWISHTLLIQSALDDELPVVNGATQKHFRVTHYWIPIRLHWSTRPLLIDSLIVVFPPTWQYGILWSPKVLQVLYFYYSCLTFLSLCVCVCRILRWCIGRHTGPNVRSGPDNVRQRQWPVSMLRIISTAIKAMAEGGTELVAIGKGDRDTTCVHCCSFVPCWTAKRLLMHLLSCSSLHHQTSDMDGSQSPESIR